MTQPNMTQPNARKIFIELLTKMKGKLTPEEWKNLQANIDTLNVRKSHTFIFFLMEE